MSRIASHGLLLGALATQLACGTTGCCFFGDLPSPRPTSFAQPVRPIEAELAPLPAPLTGARVPALGRELTLILPPGASARAPAAQQSGTEGLLGWDGVELADHLTLTLQDLPCTATPDLMAGATAEVRRRHPEMTAPLPARALVLEDPTIRAVELVPTAEIRSGNDFVFAWVVMDLGTHVALGTISRWMLADGLETASTDDARRAIAESVVLTIRRGDWTFSPHLGADGTYGDLFEHAVAPEGWVSRSSGCCNEEPPYTTIYDEVLLPLRVLGQPARARVSATSRGHCNPGAPGPRGTMFGQPMQWTHDGSRLCWVESPATADDRGITWHVRGATEADVTEALAVAGSIER